MVFVISKCHSTCVTSYYRCHLCDTFTATNNVIKEQNFI